MPRFPIQNVPTDILRTVFQSLVDDEALGIQPQQPLSPRHVRKPKVTATLALVCRSWKFFVYDTPSLWTVIVLNMVEPEDRVQAHCNRLGKLAKGAPIDLYVLHLHRPGDSWSQVTKMCCNSCPCRHSPVSLSTTALQNVRKLYISTNDSQSFQSLKLIVPQPDRIVDVSIFFRDTYFSHTTFEQLFRLDERLELGRMKSLNRLYVGDIGSFCLPPARDQPLLPTIRTLELASAQGKSLPLPSLFNILSHCPHVETLDYNLASLIRQQFVLDHPLTLKYLKTLISSGTEAGFQIFTQHLVDAPLLTEIRCMEWTRAKHLSTPECFTAIPTITRVTLYLGDATSFRLALDGAINLQYLCLKAGLERSGGFLRPLVEPFGFSRGIRYCCWDSLRTLRIECSSLEATWFQRLARTRCIPVEGYEFTESGCRALDMLELRLQRSTFSMMSMHLEGTPEWKAATVVYRWNDGWTDSINLHWRRK
jgi:hypothetical protein